MTGAAPSSRWQRRRFRRVPVTPGTMALEATGSDVIDLSPDGVSVSLSGDGWRQGQGGPVALRTSEARITGRADVVCRRDGGDGRAVLGLHLELDDVDRRALTAAYHRARFPHLLRRGEVPPGEVQDLFERSGYLALKPDCRPSDEWLAAPWPGSLTREAIYRAADGTVLGHIGVTRAYRHAWLGHEIATRRDHPEALDCRRALYHHFATWPRLEGGEDCLLLGYYNPQRPWHRRLFEDFAARCDPDTECRLLPLDRFLVVPPEVEENDTAAAPAIAGLEVSPARPQERSRVAALIAASWPALAVRAFDLGAAALESACLHPEYAAAGIGRGRQILVVRWQGVVVGAALCETVDGPLSLFNVLNCAQLFFLPGVGVAGAPARALTGAVLAFYRQRGVPSPMLVASPGLLPAQPAPGIRRAETMAGIIWTARGLARYEDYVDRALADVEIPSAPPGPPTPKETR
jgi:hypothetical protein